MPNAVHCLREKSNAAKEQQAGGGGGGIGAGYPQLRSLFTFMSEILGDPKRREQLGPVLDQLGDFGREASSSVPFRELAATCR